MTTTVGFADRTDLIPISTARQPDCRPGTKLVRFGSVTIHETANENAGATAEMHRRYWSPSGGGALISSIHYVVDGTESIQLIPTDEEAEHAGDRTGNTTSAGIEICVNSRSGYATACHKTAIITAYLLKDHGLAPVDGVTVRKHGSWPGTTHKQCPQHLNAGDWGLTWQQFFIQVQLAYGMGGTTNYSQIWSAKHPEIAYNPAFGIPTLWRAELDAGRSLGAVLTPELYNNSDIVFQCFENGWIQYRKSTGKTVVLR
jgi:N-acetylmuramoyl-L-alanine amidase CwlA